MSLISIFHYNLWMPFKITWTRDNKNNATINKKDPRTWAWAHFPIKTRMSWKTVLQCPCVWLKHACNGIGRDVFPESCFRSSRPRKSLQDFWCNTPVKDFIVCFFFSISEYLTHIWKLNRKEGSIFLCYGSKSHCYSCHTEVCMWRYQRAWGGPKGKSGFLNISSASPPFFFKEEEIRINKMALPSLTEVNKNIIILHSFTDEIPRTEIDLPAYFVHGKLHI